MSRYCQMLWQIACLLLQLLLLLLLLQAVQVTDAVYARHTAARSAGAGAGAGAAAAVACLLTACVYAGICCSVQIFPPGKPTSSDLQFCRQAGAHMVHIKGTSTEHPIHLTRHMAVPCAQGMNIC
jgi:hypothetical protein